MSGIRTLRSSWVSITAVSILLHVAPDVAAGQPVRSVTYYHVDVLGSVVAETDADAVVISRRVYGPYGATAGESKDGPGFTGHIDDAQTALVYMQQRYYDPILGVFLSTDPVQAHEEPVVYFNRYRYAASNPYRFVDPDGRAIQALWGAPAGAVVEMAAQKATNPNKPINWTSVVISTAVGAVTGGVGSVARVAAVKGTVSVGQSVAVTAGANAAVGAAGSAANSVANGEAPSAAGMAMAAVANGSLSAAAASSGAKGVMMQKMANANPSSPQGIGNHIASSTQSVSGSGGAAALHGGISGGGLAAEAAISSAQKTIEENLK